MSKVMKSVGGLYLFMAMAAGCCLDSGATVLMLILTMALTATGFLLIVGGMYAESDM